MPADIEQYEMCFSILLESQDIMFYGGNSQYLDLKLTDVDRRKAAFIYKEETGEITEYGHFALKKQKDIKKGHVYVDDILDKLFTIREFQDKPIDDYNRLLKPEMNPKQEKTSEKENDCEDLEVKDRFTSKQEDVTDGKLQQVNNGSLGYNCNNADNDDLGWIEWEKSLDDVITVEQEEQFDFSDDKLFLAIANYFKIFLQDRCSDYNLNLDKLQLVFVIPNEWSLKYNIVDSLLTPLFIQAGFISGVNESAKVIYMTELEASFAYMQLSRDFKGKRPRFFKAPKQCLVFDIHFDDDAKDWKLTYVQLAEDVFMSTLDETYNTPIIRFIEEYPNFLQVDFLTTINALKQVIIDEISSDSIKPKLSSLYDSGNASTCESHSELESDYDFEEDSGYEGVINDDRLYQVLENTSKYIDGELFYYYDEYFTNYLEVHQIMHMKTPKFFQRILEELKSCFSALLSKLAVFVIRPEERIFNIRKSIIINCSINSKSRWNMQLYKLFFHLFEEELKSINSKIAATPNLCFMKKASEDSVASKNICGGAYLKAVRKIMSATVLLPPIIITRNSGLDQLGLPMYYPLDRTSRWMTANVPKLIVSIDVCANSTTVNAEVVDAKGCVPYKLPIVNISDRNLSSLEKYFGSGAADCNGITLSEIYKRHKTGLGFTVDRRKLIAYASELIQAKSCFSTYIQQLVRHIDLVDNLEIKPGGIGFVLSVEKAVMNSLHIGSRNELSELVKETGILGPNFLRKFIIKDEGDRIMWKLFQDSEIELSSYFVNSYITDDYVYLKLYQSVDITGATTGSNNRSFVFIKEKFLPITNIYEEASNLLWSYLNSLDIDDLKLFINSRRNSYTDTKEAFATFQKSVIEFLRQLLKDRVYDEYKYYSKYRFKVSGYCDFSLSVQEVMDFAIIPTIKKLVSVVTSSFENDELFGDFWITQLFVTGQIFKNEDCHKAYHRFITTELKKEFKEQRVSKGFEIKYDVHVNTCCQQQPRNKVTVPNPRVHFCYDDFAKGELTVVSSSTYLLKAHSNKDRDNVYISIPTPISYGNSSSLLLRGDRLVEKRFKMSIIQDSYSSKLSFSNKFIDLEFCRFNQQEVGQLISESETNANHIHLLHLSKPPIPTTICIQPLNYCSCLKVSFEYYHYNPSGTLIYDADEFILTERQNLMYL